MRRERLRRNVRFHPRGTHGVDPDQIPGIVRGCFDGASALPMLEGQRRGG